jgi:hypothetical protein
LGVGFGTYIAVDVSFEFLELRVLLFIFSFFSRMYFDDEFIGCTLFYFDVMNMMPMSVDSIHA